MVRWPAARPCGSNRGPCAGPVPSSRRVRSSSGLPGRSRPPVSSPCPGSGGPSSATAWRQFLRFARDDVSDGLRSRRHAGRPALRPRRHVRTTARRPSIRAAASSSSGTSATAHGPCGTRSSRKVVTLPRASVTGHRRPAKPPHVGVAGCRRPVGAPRAPRPDRHPASCGVRGEMPPGQVPVPGPLTGNWTRVVLFSVRQEFRRQRPRGSDRSAVVPGARGRGMKISDRMPRTVAGLEGHGVAVGSAFGTGCTSAIRPGAAR